MKIRPVVVAIAMSLCQMAFAKDPVPLAKATSGDRTNHPVLFVPGLGSNSSGTWGAKGKQLYCENAELQVDVPPKVVSYEWRSKYKDYIVAIPMRYKYNGMFVPKVAYPYRCSNISDIVYGGEIVLDSLSIPYKDEEALDHDQLRPYVLGEVTRNKGENINLPFAEYRIRAFKEKFDFGKFWLIVGGMNRTLPVSTSELRDYLRPIREFSADEIFESINIGNGPTRITLKKEAYVALLKRTGVYLMADSLLARSRAVVASQSDSMSAWYPEGDWEQTFDYPTSYKETGLAYAIAETFGLPKRNMDENFAKTTNGLYFFNAKGGCRASSHDLVGADCDALDEWANPRWDTSFASYGQPNQLLDKMVRSLDDFYGKGVWHDDTNAVIDIVAHSQGGLITRIAVNRSRSRDGSNPVNHINRIITINTPHIGSALATSSSWLNKGNPDDRDATYPQLAELKEWLFSNDQGISLHGSMDLVLSNNIHWLSAGLVLLGMPYFSWALEETTAPARFDFSGAPLGPYQFELDIAVDAPLIDPVDVEHEDGAFTLGDIGDVALKSGHLAWPVESDYMREVDAMPYPTYPRDSANIHVTHFYSNGWPNFLGMFSEHLKVWAHGLCKEKIKKSGFDFLIDETETCNNLIDKLEKGAFGDSWKIMRERFEKLDMDWSLRSDLVVETWSQMGLHAETGYDVRRNAEFHPKTFRWNTNTVIHGALPEDLSDIVKEMGLAAATQQKCDILLELGAPISPFQRECSLPTSVERPATARLMNGKVALSLKSSLPSAASKLSSFDYYFAAEPGKALDVKTSGAEASVTVEHVAGAIHKAMVRPAAPAEGDWPAAGEFTLSIGYADGTPRDASNDPSTPVSDGIALSIPVFDETGRRVGGLVPSLDTTAQGVADLYEVRVDAKERSQTGNVSQPSVRVTNTGDLALPGFRLRYTFKTAKKPELRVYWIDRMPNATWSLVDLGENLHAVEFVYSGIDLKKGESVSPVDFELFHADWSPWNRADDHSALGVGGEWAPAPFVELFTLDGGRLWGISPDMIPSDSTETEPPRLSLKVLGREESALANKSTHRLRVVNDGDLPVTGFKVYDYFTSEGPEPLFEPWDVPRCAVSKEWLGGLDWRMVYDCSDAVLDPGQEIDWAEWGMLVDRHYPDWSAWDASNDWSALTSEWATATRVRVVAKDGTPLWGEAPALAAPAPASFAMGLPGPLGPEFLPPL